MADYSWFRLLIRAIALVFLGIAIPELIRGIGTVVTGSMDSYYTVSELFFAWLGHLIAYSIQLAFGLYLFFGGQWIIERSLRGIYATCPSCSYDLKGHAGPLCPECGIMLPGRGHAPSLTAPSPPTASPASAPPSAGPKPSRP